MFKGGWRIGIFHQVALLERDGRRVALAVFTSGTEQGYGRGRRRHRRLRIVAAAAAIRRAVQPELELERALVLDGHDTGDAGRSMPVGERGSGPTKSSIVSPPSRRAYLHPDRLGLAMKGELAA